MIEGMHRSAGGMQPRVNKQEAIANNLANVGTAGFKKDKQFVRELNSAEHRQQTKKADWQQPLADKIQVDFAPGVFDRTGNPLDLAIDGDGFFRLLNNDGGTVLTRSGNFQVDGNGFLTYPGGFQVLGTGGPIAVGSGVVKVASTGEVSVDDIVVDTITPVTVPDLFELERLGGSLYGLPQGTQEIPVTNATIQQGYLEQANVDVVHEMVDMIATLRAYEANANALQTQDESLEHLFQRVAGGR